MLRVKTEIEWNYDADDQDENQDCVYIKCPHCEYTEGWPVDEPRKNFYLLPIIDWLYKLGDNDHSQHSCGRCGNSFQVEWDYSNRINQPPQ